MFRAEQLEEKKDEVHRKSETRMTASIVKQDPNTQNVKNNAIYYDKKTTTTTTTTNMNIWGKSLFQTVTLKQQFF